MPGPCERARLVCGTSRTTYPFLTLTFKILLDIAENLPADSAYFQQAHRRRLWTDDERKLGDRYRIVLNDPSLGWHLAERYAGAGCNMPLSIQKYLPFRAFKYLTSTRTEDRDIARVHALWKNNPQRRFLNSLLTARDVTPHQIARYCSASPEVVQLFARLCWNVRPRWNDNAFMTELLRLDVLHPLANDGAQGELGMVSTQDLPLLRVAYRHGVSGVFKALRLRMGNDTAEAQESLKEIRQEAERESLAGVLQGLFSAENNGAIELLQTLSSMEGTGKAGTQAAPSGVDDSKMGLTHLSFTESFQRNLQKHCQEQGAERRAFEQAMMSSASQPDSPVSAAGPGADEATKTQQGQGGASQEKKAGVGAAGSPEALPAADNKMPPREGTVRNEAGKSQ